MNQITETRWEAEGGIKRVAVRALLFAEVGVRVTGTIIKNLFLLLLAGFGASLWF
ncbi:MAG: hypothetical protein LBR88_05995 [Zoogloeaceae bacterium]|jgi:hypothetical protein|nr:hypothetical protein [Zoogloeaceae bacterium]